MGNVVLDMTMSLDGCIAGPNDNDGGLHNWYFAASNDATGRSRQVIDEIMQTIGAMIMGRRAYDIGAMHDGFVDNPYNVPHFVLSHTVPTTPAKGTTEFIFVHDGIESALEQAQAVVGAKDVCIAGGADLAQQYIKAGLLDEIQIHLVPVLLGGGSRLFDHLGSERIELEQTRVIEGSGVTHLRYRVVK